MNTRQLSQPELDAKHFSERLIQICETAGPWLTPEHRDALMLTAGFVRGQGIRIAALEGHGHEQHVRVQR